MKAWIAASLALSLCLGAAAETLVVDATAPGRGSAPMLPAGFSREGFPVVAEMSFAEVPAAEWPAELAKIRAAGVDIVASPLVWRYHEADKGTFNWAGDLDVGRFAKACAEAHLSLILRPALGSESDLPKGGAPDWWTGSDDLAQAIKPLLSSLAESLAKSQSADALVALQWGPDASIETLSAAAESARLRVPTTLTVGAPIGSVGSVETYPLRTIPIVNSDPAAVSSSEPASFQFRDSHTAHAGEMLAVGSVPSYIRRPYLNPPDVNAAAIVALGSGSPLSWYQHFHGGIRYLPIRPKTLVDSPSNRPLLNADAQAPISSSGDLRPAYGSIKALNSLIHDFGKTLGSMPSFVPENAPFPWAVRTDGHSGFLFASNYNRESPAPDHTLVQFQVKLPGETLSIPAGPTRVGPQTAFIWPFNLWLGPVRLKYATAQPLCRLGSWFVFAAEDTTPPDFMFDRDTLSPDSNWHLAGFTPDLTTTFDVTSKSGATAHILVIKQSQAALAWRVALKGRPHLILTGPLTWDKDVLHVELSPGNPTPFLILPAEELGKPHTQRGPFTQYLLDAGPRKGLLPTISFDHAKDKPASDQNILRGRPPSTLEYDRGQYFSMRVPAEDVNAAKHAVLVVHYQGDCARVYLGNRMISDSFYDGSEWRIPLGRYLPQIATEPLTFRIIAAKPSAPLGIDRMVNPFFGMESAIAPVQVKLINETTQTADLTVVSSGN